MLKKQLEDPNARIIITTIQKLVDVHRREQGPRDLRRPRRDHLRRVPPLASSATCTPRSRKAFKRYNLFGFTGTPIFADERRHRRQPAAAHHRAGVRRQAAHLHDRRRDHRQERAAVPHRLRQHHQAARRPRPTSRSRRSTPSGRCSHPSGSARSSATSSSTSTRRRSAAQHYSLGDKRVARLQRAVRHRLDRRREALLQRVRHAAGRTCRPAQRLKVGADLLLRRQRGRSSDGCLDEEELRDRRASTPARATSSRTRSRTTTRMFGTSFDTSPDKFQNYYKDLSLRLKNREIDLVIVVNMFLTGFDATTLNTLWVDKNLRAHGLIQAYSRTNRILNSVKTYGNIVTLPRPRGGDQRRHRAVRQQGRPRHRAAQAVRRVLRRVRREGHRAARARSRSAQPIVGESAQKDVHRAVRRDPAAAEHPDLVRRVRRQRDPHRRGSARTTAASTSTCTPSSASDTDAEKESINDDVVFEIELIKQVEINVDYILMLVAEVPRRERGDGDDKEIRAEITRAIDASPTPAQQEGPHRGLRRLASPSTATSTRSGARSSRPSATPSSTRSSPTRASSPTRPARSSRRAFRDGAIQTTGTAITKILPPVSRFSPDGGHGEKKQRVTREARGVLRAVLWAGFGECQRC